MPTLVGLAWAVPAIGATLALLASVWRAVARPFRVAAIYLPFPLLVLSAAVAVEAILAVRIDSPETYRDWLSSSEPVTNGEALAVGLGGAVADMFLVGAASSLYRAAIQSDLGRRFDRRTGELDTLGALIAQEEQAEREATPQGIIAPFPFRRTQMPGRALVLSGGGPMGIAWESGIAAGLCEGGVDLRQADLIIGTSAGSVVGAQLALGREPQSMAAPHLAGNRSPQVARVTTERQGGAPT